MDAKTLDRFAEKYYFARQTAMEDHPEGGLCGFEVEWNLLDSHFQPMRKVNIGDKPVSFVDMLREHYLTEKIRGYSQLEVFHWMVEWVTRPYYTPRRAVYEARLMEAVLIDVLNRAGKVLNQRMYHWHGNLLDIIQVKKEDIPDSWHLAKRRYLERCVDLYGNSLATAGIHANLSIPEPLLAWDFMHLRPAERSSLHLDDFKSEFYITATRLMRAFAALFIATSASTPLQMQVVEGRPMVVVTDYDSIRNLTFPNPVELDVPNLYRSYSDYLQLSYELVRSGIRFGNNNWTPVRARSFAEPVERLIAITSEQLQELYSRGLYDTGTQKPVGDMAQLIEMQNLLARINLPMARLEIRTDDGGQTMPFDIASLTLKHLLLLRFYADPLFGRAFRYDGEDLARTRRNEELAARFGMGAKIENPFTGKPVSMQTFLQWTLTEMRGLGEALNIWDDLTPFVELAQGAKNTACKLREQLKGMIGSDRVLPMDILTSLVERREEQVRQDIGYILNNDQELTAESGKLQKLLSDVRQAASLQTFSSIGIFSTPMGNQENYHDDKTHEILQLATALVRIPSVTASPNERIDEVRIAGNMIFEYLKQLGLVVHFYDQSKYPAVLAAFPGQEYAATMLAGHFDVVEPEPDDGQFEPRVEGDYLWGRGTADMKTVVATYMVWMKDWLQKGPPYPPINLLLVGNEENGEIEPTGTPHLLSMLWEKDGYKPQLFIAGERTGETGTELWGDLCVQNRGVTRMEITAQGKRVHSGLAGKIEGLEDRIISAKIEVDRICEKFLTLSDLNGWQSQVKYPYIQIGIPSIYNITPDKGLLGIEVRTIPQDNLNALIEKIQDYCQRNQLLLTIDCKEPGIACDLENPQLKVLIQAIQDCSGAEVRLGRKLPGTSARFAPGGAGVVWGQSGIGPHARDERHFIPSILPYYRALSRYAELLVHLK
jgi:succinyl-diaminopimelate desuccinylase